MKIFQTRNSAGAGSRAPRRAGGPRAAFTLIEILVALAISTLVVVGTTTLLFSMGELWGRDSGERLFEMHARNVTRFIQREFASATLPPVGGSSGPMAVSQSQGQGGGRGGGSGNGSGNNSSSGGGSATATAAANTSPLSVQDIRDSTGIDSQLITYLLPEGSRICAWPERVLPNVVCSLQLRDGAGLLLLWHSYLEVHFDTDAPRETLISPFVTALTYDYYDTTTQSWTNQPTLQLDSNNQGILPQRLHLVFTHGGHTIETVVVIPTTPIPQGLPML